MSNKILSGIKITTNWRRNNYLDRTSSVYWHEKKDNNVASIEEEDGMEGGKHKAQKWQ